MPRTLTTSLLTLIIAAPALAQNEPVAVSLPAEGATPAVQQMVRPDRLLPVDPVMLKQGKAVAGDRSLAVAFEGNTYVFTTKDTRDTFMRDPRTYAATNQCDGGIVATHSTETVGLGCTSDIKVICEWYCASAYVN